MTLASRTMCLFCWFCGFVENREAARSPLPAFGLRIMATILILLDVEEIVKSITKSELKKRDRLWKENKVI